MFFWLSRYVIHIHKPFIIDVLFWPIPKENCMVCFNMVNILFSVLSLVEKFVPGTSDEYLDTIIHQEWHDFQVAPDMPESVEVDMWWGQVMQLKDCGGQLRFGHLATLVTTLMILPYAQDLVEQLFSLCTKNDTKFQASLGTETLCSLLQYKINVDCKCHQFRPTRDLITSTTHATVIYNAER